MVSSVPRVDGDGLALTAALLEMPTSLGLMLPDSVVDGRLSIVLRGGDHGAETENRCDGA